MGDMENDLERATRKYERASKALEGAREEVIAAIVAELRSGTAPTVVARRSPFEAAYVRRIAREHDIEPARPGPKPKA